VKWRGVGVCWMCCVLDRRNVGEMERGGGVLEVGGFDRAVNIVHRLSLFKLKVFFPPPYYLLIFAPSVLSQPPLEQFAKSC
jgi:hypothetical protein